MVDKEYLVREYINKDRTMDDIARELGIARSSLYYYIKKYNLIGTNLKNTKSITRYIDESLVDLSNPDVSYLAGLVATDGFIRQNCITLALSGENGKQILNDIAIAFKYNGEIKPRENHGGFSSNEYYELTICSSKLVSLLESKFNIVGKKSDGNSRFNTEYITNDEDCLRSYLRGIIDGDGTLELDRYRFQITEGNEVFIHEILEFINIWFGFNVEMSYRTDREGNYPYFVLNRVQTTEFLDWVYTDAKLKINYKYDKYKLKR